MAEREKILIVDDEEVNLIAFEKCLKSLDVDIVKVNSGEDALKILFNEVFSLILLDIQMPHLSGFDVADQIQKDADNSNTPIVFISAYEQDREKVTKALYCGVVDFLSKPIDPDVLRFKVKSYLELSRLRKKTRDTQEDKVNILVVDDQENNLKAIEKTLIKTGLKVITATSGEEALYILQKNIFAAILIDIQMPRMSGFDLIKNIRKLPGHQLTPLVFISAYDQDPKKITNAYTEYGLFDFISKPILPDLLITKIRSYVDVYHMRQKNDFYDSLIDLNTDGYIDWKLDQKESNLVISKNLKLNLGYEESDLENSLDSLVNCIEENSRPIFLEAINEFLQNLSNKAKTLELQFRNKNRGSVWMISKLKLLRNELGEPLRIVGFMTNITKEKSATHDLQKSNDDLDEFAYLIAHDLREPLRGIKSYVDMLMMDNSDSLGGEVEEKLIKIQSLALHSNDLLEKLLFLSRVDKRQLSFAKVNLNQQLENVVVSLENLINEKSAVIDIKKLPLCYCDSVRVPEVFRNLIENALRYNDSIQPVVEIGVCKKSDVRAECLEGIDLCKDDVVYYVKDNGIGIPLKHFKNIFKIFKSIHGRNSKYGLGTGFGLSFAKKIVENHHGQIWVDSDLGHGSCFYFTMPNTQIPVNTSNFS